MDKVLDIRFAEDNDKDCIKDIWRYCFGDTEAFVELFFDRKYRPQNTLCACVDGNVVSDLQLIPYTINLHGQAVPVDYIVGVATMPAHRGGGLVRKLMVEALRNVRGKGHIISVLMPFNFGFYRKFGWETCYAKKKYKLNMNDIAGLASHYGHMRAIDISTNVAVLRDIYMRFCVDKHG